jgi:hypothetical protein
LAAAATAGDAVAVTDIVRARAPTTDVVARRQNGCDTESPMARGASS